MKTLFFALLVFAISPTLAQAPSPFVVDANTVALWHMDEPSGTFVRDSSQFGNNGIAIGTTIGLGRFGNARSFDGFSDYINVSNPSNGSLNFGTNQSFTIDVWFKTTTQTGILLRRGLAPLPGFDLMISSGHVQGAVGNREDSYYPDTLIRIRSEQVYNNGQWHVATFERDRAARTISLYVDGILAAAPVNDPLTFPLTSDRPLTFGKWENNVQPTYFTGSIDEVRISNIARHAPPIVSDTLALYHFNEISTSTVIDSSVYRNNGMANGTTIVPGPIGNARNFNGSGDYVRIPNPANGVWNFSASQSFTVIVWVKTFGSEGIIVRRGLDDVPGFQISIHFGRAIGRIGNRRGNTWNDTLLTITSNQVINDNVWHELRMVRDRDQAKLFLYVDGISSTQPLNDNFAVPLVNDWPLTFGASLILPDYFTGPIDEVGIFRGTQHPAPVVSDTIALWHYDETTGSLVRDVSANANNGTAYGATIVPGVIGNARYFNGTSDYVHVPNPTNGSFNFNPDQSFTIDLRFKTTTLVDGIIIRRGLAPVPGFDIAISSGRLLAEIGNREDGTPPDTVLRLFSDRTYTDGQWHHATCIRDRAVQKLFLYVDGLQDANLINDNFPIPLVNDRPLTMGRWETSSQPTYFKGYIDEVGIFRGARHPAGASAPHIDVSPPQLIFGNVFVGTNAVREITVRNVGFFDTLRVSSTSSNNPLFVSNVSTFSLPPGISRTVQVTYTPSAARIDTGSLSISSNDTSRPVVRAGINGTGFVAAAVPLITSIRDIPEDQGKQVRVTWYKSLHDSVGDSLRIGTYSVWRRVGSNNTLWDFIESIPAVRFTQYSYVSPTLFDSSRTTGIRWSVFRVSAHTLNGAQVYFSPSDSGYSADNLAPFAPTNLIASFTNGRVNLGWVAPPDPDVQFFGVHRSTIPNFIPSTANQIGTSNIPNYVDQNVVGNPVYYYCVTAFDTTGNQSGPSNQVLVSVTGVEGATLPGQFQLYQNFPNPFNPSSRIRYDVAAEGCVVIRLYDMLGREVLTLVDENKTAGRYEANVNAQNLSSGVYMYRMQAGSYSSLKKMILMK